MRYLSVFFLQLISLSSFALVLNQPYEDNLSGKKILNRTLSEYPLTLDPHEAYDSQNSYLVEQIYESLYHYPYLVKNYELKPLLAKELPHLKFLNKENKEIIDLKHEVIDKTVYTIPIRSQIYYQPHPVFCKNVILNDCKVKREMTADDFVYAFKRTSNKNVNSPIVSLLSRYVVGYKVFLENPQQVKDISGVRALDRYTLEITTYGYYSQFIEWLARCLLSPIPFEVDDYYQKIDDKSIWFRYSIGTGPFMLFDNQGYLRLRYLKNPHYREVFYKVPDDANPKYLINQGKRLPMLDMVDYYLEKEPIPKWNKFLQAYYDFSTIPSEALEKVVWMEANGQYRLSPELDKYQIKLHHSSNFGLSGIAFNMQDPILGGNAEKSRLLRQAISIAFDYMEYINIFSNSYTKEAMGPIPTPLLKQEQINGFNPYIFDKVNDKVVRKRIEEAKDLLSKAGYHNGVDPKTKQPLVLTLDVASTGKPFEKAIFSWYRKQLLKLGIHLNVRENDRNRLDFLHNHGLYQMTDHGWYADYPNTENFFMLFYSKNSKKKFFGPNISNYSNPEYDANFEKLQGYLDKDERIKIENKLYQIIIKDCVWIWGENPQSLFLHYQWVDPIKYAPFFSGVLQYFNIHPEQRQKEIVKRNQAQFLPFILLIMGLMIFILPFILEWRRMNKSKAKRMPN
jgi:oligopeptide transport system substrate-binding protein